MVVIGTIATGSSIAVPFADITAIDPHLEFPYTMSYSISVQRELPYGIFLETSYVGTQSRHLTRSPDINQPSFADLAANPALVAVNSLRPYKGYSRIFFTTSDSISNYHAFQFYLTKRKGNLRLTSSYPWAKALSDTRRGQFESSEDPFDRAFNYGPTDFDRRHILVFTYTYQLPSFRGSNHILRRAVGG